MKKAATCTLLVLLVVTLTGTWMRMLPWLQTALPFEHIRHAHSHLGFLGWLFSAYSLVLLWLFLPKEKAWGKPWRWLFYSSLVVSLLMYVAFLSGGYGPASIVLLTAHAVLAYVFFVKLWRAVRPDGRPSVWFLRAAIVFFCLSSLGPFAIPVIKLAGDGSQAGMRLAVHFYLHFQYSGWFVFGFLAMVYRYFERRGSAPPRWLVIVHLSSAAIATGPLFLLTAPWLPPWLAALRSELAWIVESAPWWHLAGTLPFVVFAWRQWGNGTISARRLLGVAIAVLLLKVLLEWLVFLPPILALVNIANHFLVLTYLHLLFLGMATPAVLWSYSLQGWWLHRNRWYRMGEWIFFAGFLLTEAILMAMGLGYPPDIGQELLLAGALAMLLGVGVPLASALAATSNPVASAVSARLNGPSATSDRHARRKL